MGASRDTSTVLTSRAPPPAVQVILMRRDEESERSSVAYGSKGATKKAKKKGKKSGKSKDKDNFLIGFVVAGAAGRKGDQKQLKIDEAEVRRSGRASRRRRRTHPTPPPPPSPTAPSPPFQTTGGREDAVQRGFEMSREMTSDGAKAYCIVPTTCVSRRQTASNSAGRSHTPPLPLFRPPPSPPLLQVRARQARRVVVVYSDDPNASLDLISPASWALREVRGEWRAARPAAAATTRRG